FFNQHYQAPELMRVDGQQVSVRYDIHDPSFVMVFDTAGQFVCEAQWNRNRIDYMPKAVVEIGHEKRVRAMVKRLEQKIDTATAELRRTADSAPLSLPEPSTPLVFDLPATDRLTPDRMPEVVAGAEQAAPGRPFFSTQADRYEWLMARRGEWEDEDRSWVAEYAASEDYQQLADYYAGRGLAWAEQQGEGSRGAR
ncbi:Mu transposase C-terminal domain-containing protein, partial [Piscinibacter sakaiensis]